MPPADLLSTKPIPRRERLIVALDVDSCEEALELVERLGDSVSFYKLGLQLFMSRRYFELADRLRAQGKRVFADLKFFDVPETVASAVRVLAGTGVDFATVHGNDAMLEAAAREKKDLKILAVTVLTSLDRGDLRDLGFAADVEALVLSRARRAGARLRRRDLIRARGACAAPVAWQASPDRVAGIRPVENRPPTTRSAWSRWSGAARRGGLRGGRPPDPRRSRPCAAAQQIQATITALFPEPESPA
jgi:orotidine-5'-phosphate decarboxylase